jgi:hypothetical protein
MNRKLEHIRPRPGYKLLILSVPDVPAARGIDEADPAITPKHRAWADCAASQWVEHDVDMFDIAEQLGFDRYYVGRAIQAFTEDWVPPCEPVPCEHVPYEDDKPGEDKVRTRLALQRYRAAGNIVEPPTAPPLLLQTGVNDRKSQRVLARKISESLDARWDDGDLEGWNEISCEWQPIERKYLWDFVLVPGGSAVAMCRHFISDLGSRYYVLDSDDVVPPPPYGFRLVAVRAELLREMITKALRLPPSAAPLPSSPMDNAILTSEDLVKAVKAEAAAEQSGLAEQRLSTTPVINETANSNAGQPKADTVVQRLAEFIFKKHPRNCGNALKKMELLAEALQAKTLGRFKRSTDFDDAYRLVYKTKKGKPPVTGWELREPYRSRLVGRKTQGSAES